MTKRNKAEALDLYYREAGSWADERQRSLRNSRRIAWWVAGAACLVAVAEAVALVALAPLKTVVPYTLLVDRQTGFVQALRPVDAERVLPDAALTQSFLVQYVLAREGFDIDTLQANYRKVALWSAGTARSSYITGMQVSNPASPLATLPRQAVVDVEVKSVSPLGGEAALVRFETRRRDNDRAGAARAWVAVIRYRFSSEPLSTADRYVNPLGFQVTRYRRDAETLPPPEPVPVPTAAPVVRAAVPGAVR